MSVFIALTSPSIDIKIGEQQYKLSPLGMRQWGQYCLWLQFKEYREAKLIGGDKELVNSLYEKCSKLKIQLDSPEVISSFMVSEYLVYLLYLSASINDPTLKEHTFCSLITPEILNTVMTPFLKLMGVGEKEDEESDPNANSLNQNVG